MALEERGNGHFSYWKEPGTLRLEVPSLPALDSLSSDVHLIWINFE